MFIKAATGLSEQRILAATPQFADSHSISGVTARFAGGIIATTVANHQEIEQAKLTPMTSNEIGAMTVPTPDTSVTPHPGCTLATFKELDLACGVIKGSAFRAFKALGEQLAEGVDFSCHDARLASSIHAELVLTGRLYAGTVNAVLLEDRAQALITAHLRADMPHR